MLVNACLTCIFFNLQNQQQLEAKVVQTCTFLSSMWTCVVSFPFSNQEQISISQRNSVQHSLLQQLFVTHQSKCSPPSMFCGLTNTRQPPFVHSPKEAAKRGSLSDSHGTAILTKWAILDWWVTICASLIHSSSLSLNSLKNNCL